MRLSQPPAEPGDAIEDPGELGMGRDLALIEDDVALRIDAGGDESGGNLARAGGEFGWILPHCDRVQIDDAIDAVEVVLQMDEVADRAEIVAEVQVSRGLHTGEDSVHVRGSIAGGRAPVWAGYRANGWDGQALRRMAPRISAGAAARSASASPA
jgi:hypothetical protein